MERDATILQITLREFESGGCMVNVQVVTGHKAGQILASFTGRYIVPGSPAILSLVTDCVADYFRDLPATIGEPYGPSR